MDDRINRVKMISVMCKDYLDYVKGFGNECAYTDDIISKIKNTAQDIKEFTIDEAA